LFAFNNISCVILLPVSLLCRSAFFRWIYVTSFKLPGLSLPINLKKDYNYIDALPASEITLSYNRYLLSVNKNEHYGNKIAHNVCGKTIKAGARIGEYAATSVQKRVDKGLKVVYIILSRTHNSNHVLTLAVFVNLLVDWSLYHDR
jgi:hypothetical protein